MPDPILPGTENATLTWRIVTGFITFILALLAWTWKKQDGKVGEHETRLLTLEKNSLTREEFNGAIAVSRRETREDIENVVNEMRASTTGIHHSMESIGKRLDSILIAHLEKK